MAECVWTKSRGKLKVEGDREAVMEGIEGKGGG